MFLIIQSSSCLFLYYRLSTSQSSFIFFTPFFFHYQAQLPGLSSCWKPSEHFASLRKSRMVSSAHRSAAKGRCPCIAAGSSSPGAPGQGQLRAQGPGSLGLTCKAARPACTGSSSYMLANFIHVPSLGPVKTYWRQLHVGSVCTAFLHKATSAGPHRVP